MGEKKPAEPVATNATNGEEDDFSEVFRAGAQDELAQHVSVVDLDPALAHTVLCQRHGNVHSEPHELCW